MNARFLSFVKISVLSVFVLGIFSLPTLHAATPQAEAFYAEAMQAYQQNAFVRASELFRKATEADASYIDAWFNLGAVHYRLNQYTEAQNAFQKALWRSPNDAEIRYNLGMSLAKLNKNSEAIQQLNKVPKSHPKYAEARQQIAQLTPQNNSRIQNTPSKAPSKNTPVNAVAVNATTGLYARGLVGPTGLTVGSSGELYVANYTKNNIVKIMPNGKASNVTQGGFINGPIGLARDPRNGNLYVANYISGTVVVVNPNGQVSTLKSGFGKPYYLYFDTLTNRLFVSEQEGNQVSVIQL
jgi:hypothetical protein